MIDYSIYIEVTCCDSAGYIRKVIDKMPLIDDELIEKFFEKVQKVLYSDNMGNIAIA